MKLVGYEVGSGRQRLPSRILELIIDGWPIRFEQATYWPNDRQLGLSFACRVLPFWANGELEFATSDGRRYRASYAVKDQADLHPSSSGSHQIDIILGDLEELEWRDDRRRT